MNPGVWQLVLITGSGLLGSAHCIGMCGAIAAAMSLGTNGVRGAVLRQLAWSAGRIATYGFLGVTAGALGAKVLGAGSHAVWLQSLFAIVSGSLLCAQGLLATGWLKHRVRRIRSHGCQAGSLFRQFFSGGTLGGAFAAGLFTGFLPCGLVYGFLLLAAGSGHPGSGLLLMFCFGLGTIPVMVLTGAGLSYATLGLRQRLLHLAAISVLLTGCLTMVRGVTFAARNSHLPAAEACPICAD
ncbi:MAG: sulfite exporter TauE/SafE family protein [Planctomycetota bacterium]